MSDCDIGFDLETTGLEYFDPTKRILSGAVADGSYLNLVTEALHGLKPFTKDERCTLCGHNIKFDMNWYQGRVAPILAKVWDTSVAEALLDDAALSNSLDALNVKYGIVPPYKAMVNRKKMELEPIERVKQYNLIDAQVTAAITEKQRPRIQREGFQPIMDFLMEMLPIFSEIERRGVYVDRDWAMRTGRQIRKERDAAREAVGFPDYNLKSPKQLAEILYTHLHLPILGYTKTGQESTDKNVIKELLMSDAAVDRDTEETLKALIEYSKTTTLIGTFFDPLPELTEFDGRIHTWYNLSKSDRGGAVTGRLSSSNPNLQNIPARSDVRGLFCATPGFLWGDADYSQLELRIVASLANEPAMIEAFKQDYDIHTASLADVFKSEYHDLVDILADKDHSKHAHWKGLRLFIKRLNFGILYGIGAKKLARMVYLESGQRYSIEQTQEYIDRWLDRYPRVKAWISATENEVIERGYVRTITGRRRTLLGANRNSGDGWRKLRQAVNFKVQSPAADITQVAMRLTHMWFNQLAAPSEAHLLMNVHDQQAWEFQGNGEEIGRNVKYIMEVEVPNELYRRFGYRLKVPLKAEVHIGERWA
jgi:DNA polymerase-1